VASRNAQIDAIYDEIDTLLSATFDVDDHVDLEALRRQVVHPPFASSHLVTPRPTPLPIPTPAPPVRIDPEPVKALLGKRKKAEAAAAAADVAYAQAYAAWEVDMASLPERRQAAAHAHAASEAQRLDQLKRAQAQYELECAERDAEVAEHNSQLDSLIAGLGYGTVEAVEEYVTIVMANSAYPDHFPVDHSFEFDPMTAELALRATIIGPDSFPSVKAWKYIKAKDELAPIEQSQKASRDRYAHTVAQVALRSIHEVFEGDRRALIRSIALEVGTETIHPATGTSTYVPFVAVAADRRTFLSFDLSAVVPTATLDHLGAAVSKNPWTLTPADTSGVRRT
ncbi:MAG TPA: hypothetical protein VFD59_21105, partial [Nocardioidaceae bacterium]|nr:hypothetical protein [Nocardioidaceae bacterium]